MSSSGSKNSSPSVRNQYGSNTYKPTRRNSSDLENEYGYVKYRCDLPSPLQEAWKEGTLNPGRRFYGCSRYKDPRKKCNFFVWEDPPYPDRARNFIKELKMKLKKKDDDLHNARVDINFSERKMLVLHEEVCVLRKKNQEAATLMKKIEKNCVIMKKLLAVGIVVVFIFWLLN